MSSCYHKGKPGQGGNLAPGSKASLGATTAINQDRAWVDTWTWGMEDCELDDADNEANGDDEPSLGWSRSGAIGDTNDLESAL